MKLERKIQEFRQKHHFVGGCVIVWGDVIQAWQEALHDPHAWCPGVIAYFETGKTYLAVGGDNQKGANRWEEQLSKEDEYTGTL